MGNLLKAVAALMMMALVAGCQNPADDNGNTSTGETEGTPSGGRRMEKLTRGLVAMATTEGVYLSWRYLGTDDPAIAFNIYRDGTKVNQDPVASTTDYLDAAGTASGTYTIATVLHDVETMVTDAPVTPLTAQDNSGSFYLRVPIQLPPNGSTPTGVYTYSAGDASVGDVDGDGVYEIIFKWHPSNEQDNGDDGYTGNVLLDCYKIDGTQLWRIDLGKNIRAGDHYTQFLVYDFDGDGKAELVCKTADGTVDGMGNVIGDPYVDNRNNRGHIIKGNEYLTVFNGLTGAEIDTVNYDPPRSIVPMRDPKNDYTVWGDNYGNRSERYLACVAYLDGVNPSAVMVRGYYGPTFLTAYRLIGGKLVKGASFSSLKRPDGTTRPNDERDSYSEMGNHGLSVVDVDDDGKDEIVFGCMLLDNNLQPVYSTRLWHGDAQHTGRFIPSRPGLQTFSVHERTDATYGWELRDTATGVIIWGKKDTNRDVGRGMAANIDASLGAQFWVTGGSEERYGVDGAVLGTRPRFGANASCNFAIWWDGDVLRELFDGTGNRDATLAGPGMILKWADQTVKTTTLDGTKVNNRTKANAMLQADLFGDWREEIILRESDSQAMRIYSTTDKTDIRLYTLMHNPQYRLSIAWQNVAYNQPPHVSYYLGYGMEIPPQPDIYTE